MKTLRGIASAVCVAIYLVADGSVLAEDKGSAQDAKAMLERAVAAVKADEAKALAEFRRGGDGFRDRDLYVFCARRDGVVGAHIDPQQIRRNINDLYDLDGVRPGNDGDRNGGAGQGCQLYVGRAGFARADGKDIIRDQGGRPDVRRRLL